MKGLEEKGFKLFDVQESFGRSMEDIREKVVKVRNHQIFHSKLTNSISGKNATFMVPGVDKHKCATVPVILILS